MKGNPIGLTLSLGDKEKCLFLGGCNQFEQLFSVHGDILSFFIQVTAINKRSLDRLEAIPWKEK